jgi:hypothetical protein
VNSTGPVFGPRPLGSGPAQRPFRLGQHHLGGGCALGKSMGVGAHRNAGSTRGAMAAAGGNVPDD